MHLKHFAICCTIQLVIIVSKFEVSESRRLISSTPPSFKDYVAKDNVRVEVSALRRKVNGLEGTVSQQADAFQKTFNEQNIIIQKLMSEVTELRDNLVSHGEHIDNFFEMASTTTFAFTNNTCGGTLMGDSGYVSYNHVQSTASYGLHCLWMIQTKRSQIKVFPRSLGIASSITQPETYALELIQGSANKTGMNIKVTRLDSSGKYYIMSGPIISRPNVISRPNLHVEFDSFGAFVRQNTFPTYTFVNTSKANYESFISNQLVIQQGLVNNKLNYSRILSIVDISSDEKRTLITPVLNKSECKNTDELILLTGLDKGEGLGVDCCKINCQDIFVASEKPNLIISTSQFEFPLNFNISVDTDTIADNSDYIINGVTKTCGGVMGGTSGLINYGVLNANMGKRCVWMILPQFVPNAKLYIDVQRNYYSHYTSQYSLLTLNSLNEKIFVMKPYYENGTRSFRTQKLANYVSEVGTDELYIVHHFNEQDHRNYQIRWRLVSVALAQQNNESITATNASVRHAAFLRDSKGVLKSPNGMAQRRNSFALSALLEHSVLYEGKIYLELEIKPETLYQTQSLSDNNCIPEWDKVHVYIFQESATHEANLTCQNNGTKAILSGNEGIAIITTDDSLPNINYLWTQGNISYYRTNDSVCGGAITAERGLISYKNASMYSNNEKCIWFVKSPNSHPITFDLRKTGFEACCDFITLFTVDKNLGTLHREKNLTRTYVGPVTIHSDFVVVVFHSDPGGSGYGFILRFEEEPSTQLPTTSTDLNYIFLDSFHDTFTYPYERPSKLNEVVIFAYSGGLGVIGDTQVDAKFQLKTNYTGLESSIEDDTCSLRNSSVHIYTLSDVRTNQKGLRELTQHDPIVEGDYCKSYFSFEGDGARSLTLKAFIAVFKYKIEEGQRDHDVFQLEWEKQADCGGTYVESSGVISYKSGVAYKNFERCVWLVQVPDASEIEFKLLSSGLERCCDHVFISSLDPYDGTLSPPEFFGPENNITTNNIIATGPVVIVEFYSDQSIAETGFRLSFKALTYYDDPLPFKLRFAAGNSLEQSYTFGVESNEIILISHSAPNQADYYQYTPSDILSQSEAAYVRGSSYLRHQALRQQMVTFRPQIDANCESDELRFYEFRDISLYNLNGTMHLMGNYNATSVIPGVTTPNVNGTCSGITNSQFTTECFSLDDCDESETLRDNIPFSYSKFGTLIAIYKAVDSGDNKSLRGFKFNAKVVNVR